MLEDYVFLLNKNQNQYQVLILGILLGLKTPPNLFLQFLTNWLELNPKVNGNIAIELSNSERSHSISLPNSFLNMREALEKKLSLNSYSEFDIALTSTDHLITLTIKSIL